MQIPLSNGRKSSVDPSHQACHPRVTSHQRGSASFTQHSEAKAIHPGTRMGASHPMRPIAHEGRIGAQHGGGRVARPASEGALGVASRTVVPLVAQQARVARSATVLAA
jgi:hypothetical protein